MRRINLFFSVCLLLCVSCLPPVSDAALDIELTQGLSAGIPIAIMPFSEMKSGLKLTSVIEQDLQNSGRFNVLVPEANKALPQTVTQIEKRYWQKQQVDYVLVGQVSSSIGGQYKVNVALVDLYQQKIGKSGQYASANQVLLSKTFTIHANSARPLAHQISDLIYEQLTGDKGIFSTKLAYVLVQRTPVPLPTPEEISRNVLAKQPKAEYVLEIADADGVNPHILLRSNQPILSPVWSPDATQLAFVSFKNGRSGVYIVRLQDGKVRQVSAFPGINSAPAWSPDGKRLALVSSKTGKPKIYMLDLASDKFTQLTRGFSIDTEPSFAPDSQSLLFTSNRGRRPQVYRLNLDTHKIKRLTFKGRYNASGQFTPDGKSIIFLHYVGGRFTIAVQDLETGYVKPLTTMGMEETPSISPNGKMIVYASLYSGQGVLGMVSLDGRVNLRLPAQQGDVSSPAWSPFIS